MAKASSSSCQACQIMSWVVATLLFLATIAAIIGVWRAHFPDTGPTFGGTSSSLSLIALGLCASLWLMLMKYCCPCSTK